MTQLEGLALVQQLCIEIYELINIENWSISEVGQELACSDEQVEIYLAMAELCLRPQQIH